MFHKKEEAIKHAFTMRINIERDLYQMEIPTGYDRVSVMTIEQARSEKKSLHFVGSHEECQSIATTYYKEKYDEYLTSSEKEKRWDYHHMQIKSNIIFQPKHTILQLFGGNGQYSFACFSDVAFEA